MEKKTKGAEGAAGGEAEGAQGGATRGEVEMAVDGDGHAAAMAMEGMGGSPVRVRWNGRGWMPGVPARDLTAEEVEAFGGVRWLVNSGCYEVVSLNLSTDEHG
jgi:hypothetical protein